MHSWIFRNRRRLEAIYEGAGRWSKQRAERTASLRLQSGGGGSSRPALCVYELIPRSRRRTAA